MVAGPTVRAPNGRDGEKCIARDGRQDGGRGSRIRAESRRKGRAPRHPCLIRTNTRQPRSGKEAGLRIGLFKDKFSLFPESGEAVLS